MAVDGMVELRFDHIEVITNRMVIPIRMEAPWMVLTNGSATSVRYLGSPIGKRGLQVGHLREKRVGDRWEDDTPGECFHSFEGHTLEPGATAQLVFPPTRPPGEWRVGVSLGESNIVWSASLPPMSTDLEKPNHAVEPTCAREGARGSP